MSDGFDREGSWIQRLRLGDVDVRARAVRSCLMCLRQQSNACS